MPREALKGTVMTFTLTGPSPSCRPTALVSAAPRPADDRRPPTAAAGHLGAAVDSRAGASAADETHWTLASRQPRRPHATRTLARIRASWAGGVRPATSARRGVPARSRETFHPTIL